MAAAGVALALREYYETFPSTRTSKMKMVLIDVLIHRYHQELEERYTRPGAGDLIAGKRHEVLELLNNLTYGEGNSPEVLATRDDWFEKVRKSREWLRTKAAERRQEHEEETERAKLRRGYRRKQLAERKGSGE